MRPHGRSLRIDFRFPRPLCGSSWGCSEGWPVAQAGRPWLFSPPLPPFSVTNREGGETSV